MRISKRANCLRRPFNSIAERKSDAAIAILLLSVIVLSSPTLYYNLALTSADAKVNSLQSLGVELQDHNAGPSLPISVAQSANASVTGLKPFWIYDSSNRSIVTIQGRGL